MSRLPHFAAGVVVKGFGRGSKQLGIPTANFPEEVVSALPSNVETGIYCGWAKIRNQIHKMVISIGWNPFYQNQKKSMETYVMAKFDDDFYGEILKIVIVAYLRPEKNFHSLEALKEAINNDVHQADALLDEEPYKKFKDDPFFNEEKK